MLPILGSSYQGYDFNTDRSVQLRNDGVVKTVEENLAGFARNRGEELTNYGPAAAKVLGGILAPKTFGFNRKAIAEVSTADIPTVTLLSLNQFKDPNFSNDVAVRTVFGASEEMPIRALSYILPALHLVEGMRRSERFATLPQIQFVVMENAGASINGLSLDRVGAQTDLFIKIARKFIGEYFSQIKDQVVFATDKDFLASSRVQEAARALFDDQTVNQDSMYQRVVGKLNGHGNAKGYILLHPLVHDVRFSDELFADTKGKQFNNNPSVLINIGGQREKLFYMARAIFQRVLREKGYSFYPTIQFFSSHRVPPYTQMDGNDREYKDLSIEEALRRPNEAISVLFTDHGEENLLKRDMELIADEVYGKFAFGEFLRRSRGLLS